MADSAKLQEAHGKMKGILAEHEQHFSPKTLALFRESLGHIESAAKIAKSRETRKLIEGMSFREYKVFISDPANRSLVDEM
jgi:hypothetical protein